MCSHSLVIIDCICSPDAAVAARATLDERDSVGVPPRRPSQTVLSPVWIGRVLILAPQREKFKNSSATNAQLYDRETKTQQRSYEAIHI